MRLGDCGMACLSPAPPGSGLGTYSAKRWPCPLLIREDLTPFKSTEHPNTQVRRGTSAASQHHQRARMPFFRNHYSNAQILAPPQ